jgi:ATP-dependent helicase HepA
LDAHEDVDREQLAADVERLLSIPLLQRDSELSLVARAASEAVDFRDAIACYRRLIDEVVARYRISRRILKNRRARLVDSALLGSVARSVEMLPYDPTPLETQVSAVALDLFRSLPPDSNGEALDVLFRKTAQALCDPVALYEIASELAIGDGDLQPDPRLFEASAILDYDEHDALLEGCASAFAHVLDEPGLKRWTGLLRAAIEVGESRRISTLKDYLRRVVDHGAAKVLVFVGTYGSAAIVADSLVGVFGAEAVAVFRHDLSDDTKEDEVSRFRRSADCRVLVCDESGGEGRNFQFVDEVIHFDLPWSVSAIEQRVGRLDRIGREQAVRSTVICPVGGIEEAWFRCLCDGFGVFSRSISGLEFMLHSSERLVVSAVLQGGSEGLTDVVPRIREASERERATDEAEAVTDAASFRHTSRYLQVQTNGGDAMLEKALPAYLRSIGNDRAAKQVTDRRDLSLTIWRLSPEAVTDFELPGMQRQDDTPLNERYGTFLRTVARERRDLEFFGVGHPLVDALSLALHRHVRGRTFVGTLAQTGLPAGVVMLSAWRVGGLHLDGPNAVPELAQRFLSHRVVWAAVDVATGVAWDTGSVSRLLVALIKGDGAENVDRDLAFDSFEIGFERWPDTVEAVAAESLRYARDAYDRKFREKDAEFSKRLVQTADEVSRKRPDEGARYAHERRLTAESIEGATLVLDVVGLLRVESA